MASLRIVRGTLMYTSEYELPKPGQYARWPLWRFEDENGRDVTLENVRVLDYMRSHVSVDVAGTYIFTSDNWPILIGIRFLNGHLANGWDEWKKERMAAVYMFWAGVLMMLSLPSHFLFGWSQVTGYYVFFITLFGLVLGAVGALGCLGNLLSKSPTKQQVVEALEAAT